MVRFKPTNYDSSSHRSADSSSDAAIRLRLRHHGLSLLDLQHDGGIAHRMLAHFGHAERRVSFDQAHAQPRLQRRNPPAELRLKLPQHTPSRGEAAMRRHLGKLM
jgi:hypothetical protein